MEDTENIAQANSDEAVGEETTQTTETTESTETAEVKEAKVDPVKAEPEKPVVPEQYADFQLPDGFQLDKAALEEFMPLAKELGMTQDAAQKAISLHAKAISSVMTSIAQKRDAAYEQVMAEVKADKVLGGDKFAQNIGKINAMLGDEATVFQQALAQVAGFDTKAAKALYAKVDALAREYATDDKLIGGGSSKGEVNLADMMFPKTKSK